MPKPSSAERDTYWQKLMLKSQSGDAQAFRELLLDITPELRKFCQQKLRDYSSAEDLVQEILTIIHLNRHVYQPGRSFSAWLFAIARNKAIDVLRTNARRSTTEYFDGNAVTKGGFSTYYDKYAHAEDANNRLVDNRISELKESFDTLTPRYQNALRLVKVEGYSVKEASKKIGVTESSLKVIVHRGIKMLLAGVKKVANE